MFGWPGGWPGALCEKINAIVSRQKHKKGLTSHYRCVIIMVSRGESWKSDTTPMDTDTTLLDAKNSWEGMRNLPLTKKHKKT